MPRYIDAEAFIKEQCNSCDGACEALPCDCINCDSDCRCDMIKDLLEAPTEVVRLCTDGTHNACSFLYARAARAAAALGYSRIITYILESESGASLRSAGWHHAADTSGGDWSRPSRPRKTTAPTCKKQRWEKTLKQEVRDA